MAVAVLTPLMAWLGPLGFAPLVALAGLLCLPALRVRREDMPLAIVLLLLVAWAALSSLWSPRHIDAIDDSTALKLGLQLPLYWAAWCGARQAHPLLRRLALKALAWGLALYGVLLLAEAFSGAAIYRGLRALMHDPIEFPFARKNLAQGAFVLALLWPAVAAAGARAGAPWWLAAVMAVGAGVSANIFLADAPVLAVAVALGMGLAVSVWPTRGPRVAGWVTAALIVTMPLLVMGLRHSGLASGLPLSWAERVGYWNFAADRISEHPLLGWGLDASRTFGPAIGLHPHNGAMQVWLELGLPGAVLGALAWAVILDRCANAERSLLMAAAAASAAVYLLFGLISFGLWQEWWLALGALVAVIVALGRDLSPPPRAPARADPSA